MPTPIPIIAASVGEAVPNVRLAAKMPRMLIPASTLISAVSSGRMAPMTLPKISSKTISATANPIASDRRSVRLRPGQLVEPAAVLDLDVRAARGRGRVVELVDVGLAEGRRRHVELERRVADRAVGETVGVDWDSGLDADTTCGSLPSAVTESSTCVLCEASVPDWELKTTSPEYPPAPLLCASSRLSPVADWVPDRSTSLL